MDPGDSIFRVWLNHPGLGYGLVPSSSNFSLGLITSGDACDPAADFQIYNRSHQALMLFGDLKKPDWENDGDLRIYFCCLTSWKGIAYDFFICQKQRILAWPVWAWLDRRQKPQS